MYSIHQPNWKSIIWILLLIASAIWFIIFFLQEVNTNTLVNSSLRFGVVFFITYLIWQLFVKELWHMSFVNKYIVKKPYLAGRYEGFYISSYDSIERKTTLEIEQDLFNINCSAWGENSIADIYFAILISNNDKTKFRLVYAYNSKRTPPHSIPGDQHEGYVVLDIDKKNKVLSGYYMNDRDPSSTKGSLQLKFKSKTLNGAP